MKDTDVEMLIIKSIDPLNKQISMLQIEVNELKRQFNMSDVSNSLLVDDYWEIRCKLMEQVEENNPCDPDITNDQINAWNKYHNFIKERGQRR